MMLVPGRPSKKTWLIWSSCRWRETFQNAELTPDSPIQQKNYTRHGQVEKLIFLLECFFI